MYLWVIHSWLYFRFSLTFSYICFTYMYLTNNNKKRLFDFWLINYFNTATFYSSACTKPIKWTVVHFVCYGYWFCLWKGFELETLVVIGTDCIGKSNYHTITTTTDPKNKFSIRHNGKSKRFFPMKKTTFIFE